MIGKKKMQSMFNSVDSTRTPYYGFCLRTGRDYGIESLRTPEYSMLPGFTDAEMLPLLDEHFNKMAAGEVDEANGDMLNDLIFSKAFEGLSDLQHQKSDHTDMIRRFIVHRKADENDIERIKKEREDECIVLQNELEALNKMLSDCGEV